MTQLALQSRAASVFCAAFALCATVACATTGGSPPPCPAPSDDAIDGVRVIAEETRPSRKLSSLIVWIAEIERYCRGIDAFRRG